MSVSTNLESSQSLQPHGINRWALSARVFHWISVVLLIVTWVMVQMSEEAVTDTYINLHKAFGLSVLFWTLARIINRLLTKAPPAVPMPKWQIGVSHLTHFALYALMIAMPMSGWMMTMYGGHSVTMFGLFDIPALVSENRDMARFLKGMHKDILWTLLLVFTGLHVGGALYHQFVQKDNLLKRMR